MTAASRLWHGITGLSNKEEALFHKERRIDPVKAAKNVLLDKESIDTLLRCISNALGYAGVNRKDITRLRLAVGADEVKGLLLAWYDLCFMPYEPLGA